MFGFGGASRNERVVFGAERPGAGPDAGAPREKVEQWLNEMRRRGVRSVCCLLSEEQLEPYSPPLLAAYKDFFTPEDVLAVAVPDYHLIDRDDLHTKVLPFFDRAEDAGQMALVHCAGGLGRTGVVLAA